METSNEVIAQKEMFEKAVSECASIVRGILGQPMIPEPNKLPMSFELVLTAMIQEGIPPKVQALLLSMITVDVIEPYLAEHKLPKTQENGSSPNDPIKIDEEWKNMMFA
jgi:hypothetical protein